MSEEGRAPVTHPLPFVVCGMGSSMGTELGMVAGAGGGAAGAAAGTARGGTGLAAHQWEVKCILFDVYVC